MFKKKRSHRAPALSARSHPVSNAVKKGAAFLTAAVLCLPPPYVQALPAAPGLVTESPALSPLNLAVPENLGDIKEKFEGEDSRTVIIIQDAHAIPAAQRSIDQLIEFFQRDYQVPMVALEGAASMLDPLIFKTFPDAEVLKKIFENYYERGELAGATAAAIFSSSPAVYEGIENWDLYEAGLRSFLAAMQNEAEVSPLLTHLLEELKQEKERVYSSELLSVDRTVEAFHHNETSLVAVIRKLASVLPPEKDSELALLAEEMTRAEGDDGNLVPEVKKIAAVIGEELQKKSSDEARQDLRLFNEQFQSFQTSQTDVKAFALFLKGLSMKHHIRLRVSAALNARVGREKRMKDIEGTRLFDDLEKYESAVKESLFQSSEERELDARGRRVRLLERLAGLELGSKDWLEVKNLLAKMSYWNISPEVAGGEEGLLTRLKPHLDFYRNSEKRDLALQQQTLKLMKKNKARSTVLVAGGFHAEGLTRLFQSERISYVLVMPRIQEIPQETNYRKHMRGEVSWGDYFEVRDGKVSLYDAFVRGTRDALVKASKEERGKLLKSWRDEIIRGLAGENRIGESGRYTRFIDELREPQAEESGQVQAWRENVDRFIAGLRGLQTRGELSEQAIAGLLKAGYVPAGATAAPIAASELSADLLPGLKQPFFESAAGETSKVKEPAAEAVRSELRSEVAHVEGLKVPGGREGIWIGSEDLSARARMESYKWSAASNQPALTENGVQFVVDRARFTEAEAAMVETAVRGILKNLSPVETARLIQHQAARGAGLEPIVITKLDDSVSLFEDHKANGFAGIHQNLFKAGLVESTVQKLLTVGLEHEIRHEALSEERAALVRRTGKTEEEINALTADEIKVQMTPDLDRVVEGHLFEAGIDRAAELGLVYSDLVPLLEAGILAQGDGFAEAIRFHGDAKLRSRQREFLEKYDQQHHLIDRADPEFHETYEATREILDAILRTAGLDPGFYRLYLSDENEPNAFYLRGSNVIVVNLGLLRLASQDGGIAMSRDAIAFILAHELQHLRQYRADVLKGKKDSNMTLKVDWSYMGESRKQEYLDEYDADWNAVDLMSRAGFNVREAPAVFRKLLELMKGSGDKSIYMPFGDHPNLEPRTLELESLVLKRYWPNASKPVSRFPADLKVPVSRFRDFQKQVYAMRSDEDFARLIGEARDIRELAIVVSVGKSLRGENDYVHDLADMSPETRARTLLDEALKKLQDLSRKVQTTGSAAAFEQAEREILELVSGLGIPSDTISAIKQGVETDAFSFRSEGSGISSGRVSLPWKSQDSTSFLFGPPAGRILLTQNRRVVMLLTGEVLPNDEVEIFDFETNTVSRVTTRIFFSAQIVTLKFDRSQLTPPSRPREALTKRFRELAAVTPSKTLQLSFYEEILKRELDHSERFSERQIDVKKEWDFFTNRNREKRYAVANPAEFDAFVRSASPEELISLLENLVPVWIELEEYPADAYSAYRKLKVILGGGYESAEYESGEYAELLKAAGREVERRLKAGQVTLDFIPKMIAALQTNKFPHEMRKDLGNMKLQLFSAFMTELLTRQAAVSPESALALLDFLKELEFLSETQSYFGEGKNEGEALQDKIAELLYRFYRDAGTRGAVADLFQKQVKVRSPIKEKVYFLVRDDAALDLDQKLAVMKDLGQDPTGLFYFKESLIQAPEGTGDAFVNPVIDEIAAKKPELADLQNASSVTKRFAALMYLGALSRMGEAVFQLWDASSRRLRVSAEDLTLLGKLVRADLDFKDPFFIQTDLVNLDPPKQLVLLLDFLAFLQKQRQDAAVFRVLLSLDAGDALGGFTERMNYDHGGIANFDLTPEGLQRLKDKRTFSLFFGELMKRQTDNDMADLMSRFGGGGSRSAAPEEGYSVKDMTTRLANTRPQRFARWDLMEDADKDPLDYFSFLESVYAGRNFQESLKDLTASFPESRLRDVLAYILFLQKVVKGKLGIPVNAGTMFNFAVLRERIHEKGIPVHEEIQALLPVLGWDRNIQKMNAKFLAEINNAVFQVDTAVYEQEKGGYEDLRFYDIGGSDSQLGLAVAGFDSVYFSDALQGEGSLAEKHVLLLQYYPKPSAARDRFVQQLVNQTLEALEKGTLALDGALESSLLKTLSSFQNVSARERFSVRFLEFSLKQIQASRGQLSMDAERAEILKYFPDFSYTRDEILNQFVNRHVKTSRQYKEIAPLFVQNPETIRESQSADHLFWKDQVRDVLMNFSASAKAGFLLWLMGMGDKPDEVIQEEYRLRISFDGLRESFGLHQGAFYSGIGKRDQQDFFNSLFLGDKGIFANESGYDQFLDEIVGGLIPADRPGLREIFKAVLSTPDLARRQRILMGLLQEYGQLQGIANPEEKEAKSVRVFLQANGLIGVKLGQFLAHSALVRPGSYLQRELQELNDAAEPVDKGILFDMLEKIYNGRAFEDHFESLDELLGSASVKVVHKVTRKDGTRAVIKFKRPEVDKQIAQDLAFLEDVLQRFAPVLAREGIPVPAGLVKRLQEILDEELNFGTLEESGSGEANNQRLMRDNLESRKTRERAGVRYEFSVPVSTEVYENSVMVESFAGGIPLKKEAALRAAGVDPEAVKELLMEELLQQFFFDGFYHADLHSGNVLIQKEGETVRIHVIDLGAAAKISPENREALVGILMTLWDKSSWENNKEVLQRLLPQALENPAVAAELDALAQEDKNPIQKLMYLFALLEKNNIEFQDQYREFYSVIRFLKASEYLFSDAMLEKIKERFLPADVEVVKARAAAITTEIRKEFEQVQAPVLSATEDEGLKVTVALDTMRQTHEAVGKLKGMPFWPMIAAPFPQVEQLVDLLLGGLQKLLEKGQPFEAVISKQEKPFYEDLKSDVQLLAGLIRQGSADPLTIMKALAAVRRMASQRDRIIDFLIKQNLPLDEIFDGVRQVAGDSAADKLKALFDARSKVRSELRSETAPNGLEDAAADPAKAALEALNPDRRGVLPSRANLRQIYEVSVSNLEEFIAALQAAAEERLGQRTLALAGQTGSSAELSRAAMAQSRKLLEWLEGRNWPDGEITLALQLTNAEKHASFLTQLLKALGQEGRGARLFSDKQSQPYVIKQIDREGLQSLVASTPLRVPELTEGIKEFYRNGQPDVPLVFFDDAGKIAETLDKTFVGLTLENGASEENQDVLFHNELLLASVLMIMPEIIKSPDYLKAVQDGINRLSGEDQNNTDKIKQIKADYLKGALVQKLSELGYPPNVFSSRGGSFLTLDGDLIAHLLLDIQARAEFRKSA